MYGSVLGRVVLRCRVHISYAIRSAVCSGTVQLGGVGVMYSVSSRVLRVVSGTDSGHVHSCVSSGSIQLWWIVVDYVYGCMRCR